MEIGGRGREENKDRKHRWHGETELANWCRWRNLDQGSVDGKEGWMRKGREGGRGAYCINYFVQPKGRPRLNCIKIPSLAPALSTHRREILLMIPIRRNPKISRKQCGNFKVIFFSRGERQRKRGREEERKVSKTTLKRFFVTSGGA